MPPRSCIDGRQAFRNTYASRRASSTVFRRRMAKNPESQLWIFRGVHSRLITEATQPAPKPLSMFTTLTFEAHEFSIANSAAKPPKLAP